VYFLPLLYVKHDFEAGHQFKNDPNFLRRIGVVIPCHKSGGEIGEVLRRVSNFAIVVVVVVVYFSNSFLITYFLVTYLYE